jgi:hypothetical protein
MATPESEENDVPFTRNELRDQPGTMGKALDTADAPGKADSEMGDELVGLVTGLNPSESK